MTRIIRFGSASQSIRVPLLELLRLIVLRTPLIGLELLSVSSHEENGLIVHTTFRTTWCLRLFHTSSQCALRNTHRMPVVRYATMRLIGRLLLIWVAL